MPALESMLDLTGETPQSSTGVGVIPEGEYLAVISATDIKDAKSGGGKYIQITYEVQDDGFRGAKVFDVLNVWNASVPAKSIARKRLRALLDVLGLPPVLVQTESLHGIPLIITVSLRPATEQYGARNELKDFRKYDGGSPAAISAPQPVEPSADGGEKDDSCPF